MSEKIRGKRAARNFPPKFTRGWQRSRRLLLPWLCVGLISPTPGSDRGATPFPASYELARDAGWAEAVLRVQDPPAFAAFAERVAGWQVYRASADEWWIADAERGVGALRVLRAAPQAFAALEHKPWDTGGLFSIMTRSNDAGKAYRAALELGWSALHAPVSLQFGDVTLANVVLRGPDAVHIAVYERLAPRLPDAPDLQKLRRPFNAMQVVDDLATARRFYVDVLGFEVIATGRFQRPAGAPSNFGIPPELSAKGELEYLIVGPSAKGPTQLEVVSFPNLDGRVRPPPDAASVGFIALRLPVSTLEPLRSRLAAAGYPFESGETSMPPFGIARTVVLRSPEGARLEFFELPSRDRQPAEPQK